MAEKLEEFYIEAGVTGTDENGNLLQTNAPNRLVLDEFDAIFVRRWRLRNDLVETITIELGDRKIEVPKFSIHTIH